MADKFRNPFDFVIDDERININTRPTEMSQPQPVIFKPYEVASPPKATTTQPNPTIFVPIAKEQPQSSRPEELKAPTYIKLKPEKQYELDEYGDPPLLDDLGIDIDNIKDKIKMVALLKRPTQDDLASPDLSGPVIIALTLGFLLLFSGQIHFGDIYGMSIIGTVLLYFLLNFMSQTVMVPVYDVMSILGYGLLPMLVLGAINIFFNLKGAFGLIIGIVCSLWSCMGATAFFEVEMKLPHKKWLIAYPVLLFYLTFVLITIF